MFEKIAWGSKSWYVNNQVGDNIGHTHLELGVATLFGVEKVQKGSPNFEITNI